MSATEGHRQESSEVLFITRKPVNGRINKTTAPAHNRRHYAVTESLLYREFKGSKMNQ